MQYLCSMWGSRQPIALEVHGASEVDSLGTKRIVGIEPMLETLTELGHSPIPLQLVQSSVDEKVVAVSDQARRIDAYLSGNSALSFDGVWLR